MLKSRIDFIPTLDIDNESPLLIEKSKKSSNPTWKKWNSLRISNLKSIVTKGNN
jgi:hypothetical protein